VPRADFPAAARRGVLEKSPPACGDPPFWAPVLSGIPGLHIDLSWCGPRDVAGDACALAMTPGVLVVRIANLISEGKLSQPLGLLSRCRVAHRSWLVSWCSADSA
jgi:hypothetical protein